MTTPYLSLLSLLLLLSLSFFIQLSSSATIRCYSDEREILLQIKKSFNNPYFLASWDPNNQIDCCKWYALKCDPTKKNHITQLNIFDTTDVSGQIPANISQLSYLQQIDFNRLPNLTGPIPSSIGNLKSLTFLRLGSNQLSGPIPSTLGQLSSLTFLDLSGNRFTGSIPPSLGNLVNLDALYLAINQLSGSIPASLGKLVNLGSLRLESNQLSGSIPAEFTKLTKLQTFNVTDNKLCGAIPQGGALQSFDSSSYAKNKCLCGSPLSPCK